MLCMVHGAGCSKAASAMAVVDPGLHAEPNPTCTSRSFWSSSCSVELYRRVHKTKLSINEKETLPSQEDQGLGSSLASCIEIQRATKHMMRPAW